MSSVTTDQLRVSCQYTFAPPPLRLSGVTRVRVPRRCLLLWPVLLHVHCCLQARCCDRQRPLGGSLGCEHNLPFRGVWRPRKVFFGKQTLSLNYIDIAGVVTSPNFPNSYPNRIDRTDMIYVAAQKLIEIEFTNFTVQPHPQCRGNQLSIVDQDGSELLGISCGLQLPPGEV